MKRGSLLMAALVGTMASGAYTSEPRPEQRPSHVPVDTRPSDETQAAKIAAAEAKRARKLARNAAMAARNKEQP